VLAVTLLAAGIATAASDTLGKTTLQQRIVPDSASGFRQLSLSTTGEPYITRTDGVGTAKSGRASRRTSLAYFGQLSDFQLADEESPARVEALDAVSAQFSAAFRPWEALEPQIDDAMIRQMNTFVDAGPVAAGSGHRPKMDFTIDTGDSADSQQLNETEWVQTLLDGGTLDPNSGTDPAGNTNPLCAVSGIPGAAEAALYTGVQDPADYPNAPYYQPDLATQTAARYLGFPQYTGLMNRAQQSFTAAGLDVPSYVTFGNHDALVQGNVAAKTVFETVATGCIKPLSVFFPDGSSFLDFSVQDVLDLHNMPPAGDTILTPPDEERRYVSKSQYKQVFLEGAQDDGHGFGHIDPAEETASGGAVGYYGFNPVPGLRMISLDTVSEGGEIGTSADGNIDDPQFRWLEGELQRATERDELVILFSHHAIGSLTADVPDEDAPACTVADPHGHDVNPGCDVDPRDSTPIHLGDDMVALLHRYPHVIAWIAGHSHENRVEPYADGNGGGFWMVRAAAEADWPQQARLLELFDNKDGTLSLFNTVIDHAGPASAPAPGPASGFDTDQLASLGRTIGYNDPDAGARNCAPVPCGEGTAADRNVELLISDPRVPVITRTDPTDGYSGFSRKAPITVLFNKPMDKSSVEASFSLKRTANGERVAGSFSWVGNLLKFTPSSPLAAARVYTATVGTGARSAKGFPLAAAKAWTFSTTPQPLIIHVHPPDGAAGVSRSSPVVVAFDQEMDKQSAQAAFSLRRTKDGAVVPGAFGWLGKALIFQPTSPLAAGVTYTARETNQARNVDGRPLESGKTWVFTAAH
jgi:metallophosphoesterase (TIGR03767 family)